MNNTQLKRIVVVLTFLLIMLSVPKYINDYKVSQYSKRLISSILSDDIETAKRIIDQCPESVNSLPSIMPYCIRVVTDVPEIFYPLQEACIWENYDMVKLLIDNGANINCASPGLESSAPPLTDIVKVHIGVPGVGGPWPIDEEDLDIIYLLLEKGADKSIKDEHGKTAYDYASELEETYLQELFKY